MGLANIKRCVDEMTLTSAPGSGTCLEMLILLQTPDNSEAHQEKGLWN
jgi:anti-sigma regulatory factor (Ser/Thr protein kinase)